MAHNDALLRAIIAHPDEDTTRLAYADWLDENGDSATDGARAEFIRVQIALAETPADDPQRPERAQREKELLDRHGWAWAEEFGTQISAWQYRRGFIEYVEMGLENSRAGIGAVLSKAPIQNVRDISQFCDLDGLVSALPDLNRLTGLELWYLYAFDNKLLGKILTSRHLSKLRTLILHHDRNGNMAQEKVLVAALNSPHRKNIEELTVNVDGSWRGPSRRIVQAIAKSPYLRKLRKLNLDHAGDKGHKPELDVKTVQALGASPNLAHLEELDLGNTGLPIKAWDEVLKWPFLARLKWLRLHSAQQVHATSGNSIADLQGLPKYRQAFERLVPKIDWDTEYLTPWDKNASWKGLSWDGLKQRHLFAMWPFVQKMDYDGLEAAFRADCVKCAGETAAKAIDAVNFKRYQTALAAGLKQAIGSSARRRQANAIYLRIRPDMQWNGEYHVTTDNNATGPFEPHESFSYGSLQEFEAPSFPDAATARDQFPATKQLDPGGAYHYLLARTVAAFGRCLARNKAPVAVFFSCMYAVFRMSEPPGSLPTGVS